MSRVLIGLVLAVIAVVMILATKDPGGSVRPASMQKVGMDGSDTKKGAEPRPPAPSQKANDVTTKQDTDENKKTAVPATVPPPKPEAEAEANPETKLEKEQRSAPPPAPPSSPSSSSSGRTPVTPGRLPFNVPTLPSAPAVRAPSKTADADICPQSPLAENEIPASCPNESEIIRLYAQRRRQRLGTPTPEKWTLVDVGVNKGYSVSSTLEAIGVNGIDEVVTGKSLFEEVKSELKRGEEPDTQRLCGACCDCGIRIVRDGLEPRQVYSVKLDELEKDPKATTVPALEADYYAVDGQPANARHLRNLYAKRFKPSEADHVVRMNVTHAAVSSTNEGTVIFPNTPLGDEIGYIGKKRDRWSGELKTVKVPRISLDGFLPESVQKIDVLLTDTEGHDFYVLDGMTRFIRPAMNGEPARRNVKIYVFETHGKDRPLRKVLDYVESSGYVCYFPLTHQRMSNETLDTVPPLKRWLLNISGPCWQDRYNKDGVGWKNVVCFDKTDEDLRWVAEQLTQIEKPIQTCIVSRKRRQELAPKVDVGAGWKWLPTYTDRIL